MQYTLTLSRWHKVAERISTALKAREMDVKAAFTATTISAWNREGVEEKAAEIARRAADDLALIEAGMRAVATIRAALAIRNAALGVSGKLAEAEAANRAAAIYKAIIDGQKVDMVRPESVERCRQRLPVTRTRLVSGAAQRLSSRCRSPTRQSSSRCARSSRGSRRAPHGCSMRSPISIARRLRSTYRGK